METGKNEGETINDFQTFIKLARSSMTTIKKDLIVFPVDDAKLANLETTDITITTRNIGFEYIITYPNESDPSRIEYKNNIFDVIVGDITEN
jgi:hypothetical protein